MSDPAKYRTQAELDEHKKRDPVALARTKLLSWGVTEEGLKAVEDAVETVVQGAVKFADESPEPDPSILEETTYDGPFAS